MKNTKPKFFDGLPEILPIAARFFKSVALGLLCSAILLFLLFAENADLLWSK